MRAALPIPARDCERDEFRVGNEIVVTNQLHPLAERGGQSLPARRVGFTETVFNAPDRELLDHLGVAVYQVVTGKARRRRRGSGRRGEIRWRPGPARSRRRGVPGMYPASLMAATNSVKTSSGLVISG